MTETCAKCGNQTVTGHSLILDGTRRVWRVCCLCAAELIAILDAHAPVAGQAGPS